MKVDIWSDVVCPWCYIGKRHIEAALADFPYADAVEIEWHSYELDPRAPREREGDYPSRLARKYGVSVEEAMARMDHIVGAGAEAGIDFDFRHLRAGNTFDAHRLLHLAKEQAAQHALKERFLRATFVEAEPIGDQETLVRLAVDAGVDEVSARETLGSERFADDVRADEQHAADIGIQGVPFFVFAGKYGISGAHPVQAFRRILDKVWNELNPVPDTDPAAVCDSDGECAV